jgi:UDP-glucose:(heptosyl)LPS alpha-1,3-glucosyltransferase
MPHPSEPVQPSGLPPQLLFVRQRFTPFGGGELILDRIISAMLSRGVRVGLLGRAWTGRRDIEFIPCDPPRFPRYSRDRRFADAACTITAGRNDALVQSHERMPCCDLFRAGDGLHTAYLDHRARGLNPIARATLFLQPFHRATLRLERDMFASARLKAVLANSTMVAEELVRYFSFPRHKIHIVPNGIDLGRFNPGARERHRIELRRNIGTDPSRPVALFVGSGFKRKGLDTAIRALAAIRADAELWVIGSDRRPAAYAALAKRMRIAPTRIRLFGPVLDPLPYFAAADVLLLPSTYDPFPSTVLEALACGLPVVTSTSCGARDAAARLDPDLVRDAYDVDGIAEALRRAFDLAIRPATVAAAHAIAMEYGVDQMVERMLAVYSRIGNRSSQ